ncbi:hypothetical protein MIND_01028100 [Mycena indigotica]|uniref:Phorbol-ester/DAG-type domain-containing protein n=1 Tax=Mycena indigotica TaxID=2126181 RepID=A0A8H6VV01_9AGAR|nr:uncharacterized protein MIND_01028100 [Mycena indigotica]KAF7294902.1 hypothetical protein MIND_01028100 [Mycena indigotica]
MSVRPPPLVTSGGNSSILLSAPSSPLLDNVPPSPLHKPASAPRPEESRTLLGHVLNQLTNRPLPPSVYDISMTRGESSSNSLAAIAQTVRGAVKLRQGRMEHEILSPSTLEEEDEDDDGHVFSPEPTLGLMVQLRHVLHIFTGLFDEKGAVPKTRSISKSPFRLSRNRNSLQPSGRRSRSPSPANHPNSAPDLLSQCISVLSSVILEDCRFQIRDPGPLRPPNALQAVVLDVALYLLSIYRHDAKVVSDIGLALIPAFNTFPRSMHVRLLAFFEDGVIRYILEDLARLRGQNSPKQPFGDDVDVAPAAISITVDSAADEGAGTSVTNPYGWVPWTPVDIVNLRSGTAPFQSQAIYSLAAIVPPLIAAVLESVAQEEVRTDVIHRYNRLVQLIVAAKPDAYLDVLEVVAYHTHARRSALRLLSTIWPQAFGHFVVAKALSANPSLARDHPYTHQFTPWHFYSSQNPLSAGLSQAKCHSCSSYIEGFGLACTHCFCTVHFGCYDYPEGSAVVQYSTNKDVQRIATFRFSPVLSSRRDEQVHMHGHSFQQVNIFTLCLCCLCRKPLWGCTRQGLACVSCSQFAHSSCLESQQRPSRCYGSANVVDPKTMSIQWSDLRQSCREHYGDVLDLSAAQLATRSYEEISLLSAMLWTQWELLTNGVSSGSIEVLGKGRSVTPFELNTVLSACNDLLLEPSSLRISMAFADYLDTGKQQPSPHGLAYTWSTLAFIASTIKAPYPLPVAQGNFLNVADIEQDDAVHVLHPFELVNLAHLRNILGYEFTIHSDAAAQLFLKHIFHLGFFDTDVKSLNQDSVCSFPLPLGLDLSTNVETLVAAVEACLTDLDLSVNEAGFLLLVRKLWPNGMFTEYIVTRLTRIVLTWIFAEDDYLGIILRDYLAKQRPLPGIRPSSDPSPWPTNASSRATGANVGNTGGDYVTSRRALQNRYAAKWLFELHLQDSALYTTVVYEICEELSKKNGVHLDVPTLSNVTQLVKDAEDADRLLRAIIRVAQSTGAPPDVSESWLLRWLEHISLVDVVRENMTSLHRLFPRENDPSQRFSMAMELAADGPTDASSHFDPWRVVMDGASSADRFSEGLKRLLVFANSGVNVPLAIFERFSAAAVEFDAPLSDAIHLVDAILASSWLRTTNRNSLQTAISRLHSAQMKKILHCLAAEADVPSVITFVRKSLAACLVLFGDRKNASDLNLLLEPEVAKLPSRRRINVRTGVVTDPIVIHHELLSALEAYITANNEEVISIAAKFLNAFLNDSPYLESYEVDNFILRNGRMLAKCAWQFYGIQRHDIHSIRTSFLLRVVLVDSQPFQELLHDSLLPAVEWEMRLLGVSRLFRIVLDVTSPAFYVEGRQWRSSIIEVFYRFFFALWTDEKEEIRVVVDTFASGLLPAHLESISQCWVESMSMPIAERVKLASFLIQLRPYFPQWQVLSWDVLVDALSEEEEEADHTATAAVSAHLSLYGLASSKDEVGVQSTNTDASMAILRSSLLLLSLQMIADGIPIDWFTIQKIKASFVKALGFADVTVTPSSTARGIDVFFGDAQAVPDTILPCLNELLPVLDSAHVIKEQTYLVGSTLVDVTFNLFCTGELHLLPVLTLKSLVESLGVIIYKHDFDHRSMKHLQPVLRRAVLRALDLMLEDVSYEVRQLALSATQAFIKRWPAYIGTVLYTSIEQVSKLVMLQSHNTQDALVSQAKSFVEYSITQYERTGFISSLFKRRLDKDVLLVFKEITDAKARLAPQSESLRDVLMRGLLSQGPDNDHTTMQNFLNNLETFVEIVHHQGYSADLMRVAGQQLLAIARRVADLAHEGSVIEPAPLLGIPALLIQHNKPNSRELLICADTILRNILLRLNVEASHISRLLHVTASLQRKTHLSETAPIIATLFEILTDALRLKNRTPSGTVRALLEVIGEPLDHIGSTTLASTHPAEVQNIVEHGLHYLHNHIWTDIRSENDFTASLAVGKMILQAAAINRSIFSKIADPGDRVSRLGLGMRSWNLMVLAVLLDSSDQHVRPMFEIFEPLASLHHNILRPYSQSSAGLEAATADINHAYIAIKLWLLLAQKRATSDEGSNATFFMVWNELWPPLEAMMTTLEGDLHLGLSMTIASLIWGTIADLFLFLRGLRSPLALETQFQIAVLNRLRSHGGQDSAMSKLTRTAKTLSEPVGDAVDLDILVQQAGKELVATEKMRVLTTRGTSG